MTLTDFIDNFGASLDKGDEDSAKDFDVTIEVEFAGETLTYKPTEVRFDHRDKTVTIITG